MSRPLLLRLNALPRAALLIGLVVVLGLGLFVPGAIGAVFLFVIGAFLLWLALLAWPVISPGSRALRVGVALGVLGYAIAKAVGFV